MIRYDRRTKVLAACLSAVAGYVDAIGFIKVGGFYVSFMSGNSTRLAVAGAELDFSHAALAAILVVMFVLGVVMGSLTGSYFSGRRRFAVLLLVALLLFLATVSGMASLDRGAVFILALAMGAENAVFERDGEVHLGLTYMTGTLVKFGQHLTAALLGREGRLAWLPYFCLWLGLLSGAFLGALAYPIFGLESLVAAVAATIALAMMLGEPTSA